MSADVSGTSQDAQRRRRLLVGNYPVGHIGHPDKPIAGQPSKDFVWGLAKCWGMSSAGYYRIQPSSSGVSPKEAA